MVGEPLHCVNHVYYLLTRQKTGDEFRGWKLQWLCLLWPHEAKDEE